MMGKFWPFIKTVVPYPLFLIIGYVSYKQPKVVIDLLIFFFSF